MTDPTVHAFILAGRDGRWWLYFLTYALLIVLTCSIVWEMAQATSRWLSRLRLWVGSVGMIVFLAIIITEERVERALILASFATGVLVSTLLFFGWLGLQRRRR